MWVSQTQTKLREGNLHVEELRNIYKTGSALQMNKGQQCLLVLGANYRCSCCIVGDISASANACVAYILSASQLFYCFPVFFVTVVEGTVNKIKSLLLAAQDWEQKMKTALKEKSVVIGELMYSG